MSQKTVAANFYLIIIFSLFCLKAHSINNIDFFDTSSFHYKFDSYMGTDYYPTHNKKFKSYLEKSIFSAGLNFKIHETVNIWFDLSYRKRLFTDQLELESTGIILHKKNWNFIYKIDKIEIGNRSEIFHRNIYSTYYENPVVEDYKFQGFEVVRYFGNFSASGMIGGNSFNSLIGKAALGYSMSNHDGFLYYLFCKRDREFNYPMHAIGFEMLSELKIFKIYNSIVYEILISTLTNRPSQEKILNLTEIIYNPSSIISIGTNFLYSVYDNNTDEEWQSTSFIELITQNVTNTVSYKYWDSEMGFIREINLITSFSLLQYWTIAANISYFNPSIGDDYYHIGMQTKIEYEMD
jgi:hypothetical protein